MSKIDLVQIFAIFGLTGTILMGAVAYLIKTLISHFLNKDFEKYKSDINLEVEKYKLEIQLENTKRQIIFSKLHNERALIIKEVYSRLFIMERSISAFMRPLKSRKKFPNETEIKKSAECYNEFIGFYGKNKIYFSKNICKLIDEINSNIMKVWGDAKEASSVALFLLEKMEKDKTELWIKSWEDMKKNAKALRGLLEDEFRVILGVETNIFEE